MLDKLPKMVAKWKPILGEEFDLGIGLNTGTARVGNTGTIRKFKYGPLGTTVNLASRVQGATKHFKARLIITGQTKAAIEDSFATGDSARSGWSTSRRKSSSRTGPGRPTGLGGASARLR